MKRLREGTIFETWYAPSLATLTHALYLWSNGLFAFQASNLLDLDYEHVVIKLYQKLREVCGTFLHNNPIVLGGNGAAQVVQADESMLHHRQRVSLNEGIWLFENKLYA